MNAALRNLGVECVGNVHRQLVRRALVVAVAIAAPIVFAARDAKGDDETPVPVPVPAPAPVPLANAEPASTPDASSASEPPPTTPREPVEVRVIGDKADALQKLAGSATLISQKEIQRAQPYDAAEMLRRVPGVQVRQEEGGGLRLDIGLRGLDPGRSRRVLVLEDGIPVAINPYAEPDLYFAPPIERMRGIEVVKGSGAILFGPQTIGGVINFFTVAPTEGQHSVVDVQGGNLGYMRALAQYGDGNESVRYFAQGFYKRGDGIRGEAYESADVFGKVAISTSARNEATLKIGFHLDHALSDDVGLTRAMFARNPRRPTLAPDDVTNLRRLDISLTDEYRISEHTKLRTLLYAYNTTRDWRRQNYVRAPQAGVQYDRVLGDPGVPDGAIYFRDSSTILARSYDVAGVEPRLEHRFATGSVEHTLDAGARFLYESAKSDTRAGEFARSESGALTGSETHRTYAAAAYAQDRIAFRPDLFVTPGIRFEHADFQRRILRQTVDLVPQDLLTGGTSSSNAWVPGIGMLYGQKAVQIFAGIHVGYAPPRATSSISATGKSQILAPEENIQYEVGTRVAPAKWIKGEATGFLSNFRNQVVSSSGVGADVTELVNAGATRHYGVEASLDWRIGKQFAWPVEVDLLARYTYLRAYLLYGKYAGNALPYAPPNTVSLTADVDHKSGFGGEVSWTWVDSQFTDFANTVPEDVTGRVGLIPSRNALDMGVRYRHKPSGISVRLVVKNALDDVVVGSRRPEGIFATGFRQVILGGRWEWDAAGSADKR